MAVNTGNVEIKACVRDSCTANVGCLASLAHTSILLSRRYLGRHPCSHWSVQQVFLLRYPTAPPHHPGCTIGETLDVGFFTSLTRWKPCPSPPTAAGAVPIPTSKAGLTLMTCPGWPWALDNKDQVKFSETMLDAPERQPARDLRAYCSILQCGPLADRYT